MIQHANDCARLNIPFIFDPGQQLPMFNRDELRHFIELATYVAVNEYEGEMLSQLSGWTTTEIASRVKALIITCAERGATIYQNGEKIDIPCVRQPGKPILPDAAMLSADHLWFDQQYGHENMRLSGQPDGSHQDRILRSAKP